MTQPDTIRQVRVSSIDEVDVQRVPAPVPAEGELLIRTSVVGICGSDLHAALGKHPFIDLPYQPGHEAVGVVYSVGAGVERFAPGDRVLVEPNLYCGQCRQCRSGRYNICQELKVFGCQTTGAMADLFTIAADRVHLVPAELSDVDAALVEPLATAVHSVRRAGDLHGRTVVVLGAGPIGLLVSIAARQAGASRVVVTDLVESKRRRAVELGADAALPADAPDLLDQVRQALDGPADVVADCVSGPASIDQAVRMVDKGGTVLVVGVAAGAVPIRLDLIQDREIAVIGNLMYVRDDMTEAIRLIGAGAVPVNRIVTATFPLDDAALAFQASHDTEQVKVLVVVPAS
jgi:2-desacetyl-2-hydroxyethyl bacteriochlorophyllide A dehydrogenase